MTSSNVTQELTLEAARLAGENQYLRDRIDPEIRVSQRRIAELAIAYAVRPPWQRGGYLANARAYYDAYLEAYCRLTGRTWESVRP